MSRNQILKKVKKSFSIAQRNIRKCVITRCAKHTSGRKSATPNAIAFNLTRMRSLEQIRAQMKRGAGNAGKRRSNR